MDQYADQNKASRQICAVVTGGARNIGQAIALRLQQDGYRVIVVDIVEPEAAHLIVSNLMCRHLYQWL